MPLPSTRHTAVLLCASSLASAWLLRSLYLRRQSRSSEAGMLGWLTQGWAGAAGAAEPRLGAAEEEDGEEEFLDPISLACMQDPALLCATGQIYCLTSLRDWLATGSRTCPKTNVAMRDVEVVRLPSMRTRIAAWLAASGLPPLPPLDPPIEVVRQAGEAVAGLLAELRSGDVYKRGLAAGAVNDMLIDWGQAPRLAARQQVMEAMLLDLVWLMRQGDPYGSGVAACALSQYSAPDQLAFLAAVAAMPAVALLWSPHSYGQHSAARLLSALARATPSMPAVLVEAGAVRGLLQQLDLRVPFQYGRCSAASALTALCKCPVGRQEVLRGDGVRLLSELVLQQEPDQPGPRGEYLVRFDKRDAAGCLLALQLGEGEAEQSPDAALLRQYKHCSHAWLLGRAPAPTQGYSAEEAAAGLPQLAAGEGGDSSDDGEAGDGDGAV